MFGLFKKRNKKVKGGAKKELIIPVFGTAENFMNTYTADEKHLAIGSVNGKPVDFTVNSAPANDIIVINDKWTSAMHECIVPTVVQGKLSYIVYDPEGECYATLAHTMRAKGYDVQLVDLADEEHKSRIDLFEVANITKNPYWTSIMLASAIRCEQNEIVIAHSLLMAMMERALEIDQHIDINDMLTLFGKIKENDKWTILEIKGCIGAKQYISAYEKAPEQIKSSVLQKIEENLLVPAISKVTNPNIVTITAHKKRTVIFVKKVPSRYKYLITALLFNLKATSVMCEGKSATTIIIDSAEENWCQRSLLNKICLEAGLNANNHTATMMIRNSLKAKDALDITKNQLLVYMHSDDEGTREYVRSHLQVKNQITEEEQAEISKQKYRGKKIPEDVLNACGITMEELSDMKDSVVIDTSRKTRPFRCDRLQASAHRSAN